MSTRPPPLSGGCSVPRAQRRLVNQPAEADFEAALLHCEVHAAAANHDACLSAEVPKLLRRVFDTDFDQMIRANADTRSVQNVTCMRPADGIDPKAFGCFNDELLRVPLQEGRACRSGACSGACSRVQLPRLATPAECSAFRDLASSMMPPGEQAPIFNLFLSSAVGDLRTTLLYVRLIERLRRAVAHEYGLALGTIRPCQTFVSRIIGHPDGSRSRDLHADEASFGEYHYSAVLYLSTQQEDFEGGRFVFSDPPSDGRAARGLSRRRQAEPPAHATSAGVETNGRMLSSLEPTSGTALLFSSGWENMHFVSPTTGGCRFAVPAFFVTQPEDEGRRRVDHDVQIAEILWQTLCMPETEHDFAHFMNNWHELLA